MKRRVLLLVVIVGALTCPFKGKAQATNVQDSLALIDLYNNSGGAFGYLGYYFWDVSQPVNNWYGVTVNNGGRVTGIQLQQIGLYCSIPPSFGNLSYLNTLSITICALNDSIPSSLGNLSQLTDLELWENNLSGPIPSSLGKLSNLITLNLGTNYTLSGSIPSSLGGLSSVQQIYLDHNAFTGNIPASLGKLTNLKTMFLYLTQLGGTVPSSLENLPNLTNLRIDQDSLTFAGMEGIVREFDSVGSTLTYSPQSNIPLIQSGNKLSVSVGGTPANNTFYLYNLDQYGYGTLVQTQNADSVFTITQPGAYYIAATNSVATQLTLYTNAITLTTLPLSLLSFTGQMQHDNAVLNWQTTDEIDTKSFTVERSPNGTNYTALGSVAAKDAPGTNNYTYTDTKPLQGENYYRLKMYDKDGNFTYSGIVPLNNGNIQFALNLYPNPAGSSATLGITTPLQGKYSVAIADATGKIIRRLNGVTAVGANSLQLDVQGLAAGVYIVTYTDASGVHNLKLVKQ